MISAKEAKALSEQNAKALKAQEAKEAKTKAAADTKKKTAEHKKWREDFLKGLQYSIESSTKYGHNIVERTMQSGSNYGGSNYYSKFEYTEEVQSVIEELYKAGYQVTLNEETVEHDESAAYLNSGGECGSETPYYTRDMILRIKW